MLLKNVASLWPPFGRRESPTPGENTLTLNTLTNLWPPFSAMDISTVTLSVAESNHAHSVDRPAVTTNIRYWVNDSLDGSWHNPLNWAVTSNGTGGAGVPTGNDDVYFDSGSTTNCLVTSGISVNTLTVASSYTGTLNFNSQVVYCTEDLLFNGGTIRLGYDNTINVGGNVTFNASSVFYETATLYLTGVGKTVTATTLKSPYSLTVAVGASYSMPNGSIFGNLTVNGSLAISGAVTVYRTALVNSSGSLTGAGTLNLTSADGLTTNSGGSWDITTTTLFPTLGGMPSVGTGTYNSTTFNIINNSASAVTTRPQGTIKFSNNFHCYISGSGNLLIDCATNNPSFTASGNWDVETGIVWTKGTGSLLFSGTKNQSARFTAHTYEDIQVNKTGGRLTLLSSVTTDQFVGTDGDFDLDGFTVTSLGITDINGGVGKFRFHNGTDYSMDSFFGDHGKFVSGGNLTLDGDASSKLRINDLDFEFNLPATGVAHYCIVQNSVATGTGTPINAEDGTNTDVTGNTGWDFNRDLVVSSSDHGHSADSVGVNAYGSLAISDTGHSHTADSVDTNSHVVLDVSASDHTNVSDAPTLVSVFTLVIAPADHAQTADQLYLASTGELGVLPGSHSLTSDSLNLVTFATVLGTEDSTHSQTADEPTLQVLYQLVVSDGSHANSAEITSSLLSLQNLASQHALASDSVAHTVEFTLTIGRVNHAQRADSPTLAPSTTPVVPDPDQHRDECTIICGPQCDWIFCRLRAWPLIKGGTRVEWTLHPRFAEPQPHTFQLQFGRTGNPLADDWTNVGLPVVNTYYAYDDTKRVNGNFQWTHYRVLLTTAQATYASQPQNLYGSLPKRQWRIAREIERLELLRLRKEAGQEGYLLKRKLFGDPCVCLDPQTHEVNNPQCPLCYGTGISAGYYDPYPCFYAELGLDSTNNRLDGGQTRGTVDDSHRTVARMINSPQLFSHDVWVDRDTDFRWEIHSVRNIAEVTGVPIVVQAELRRLPFSHPVYDIVIDNQIPS